MSNIKISLISVVVLVSLLACGGLPQAHLTFDTQGAEQTSSRGSEEYLPRTRSNMYVPSAVPSLRHSSRP